MLENPVPQLPDYGCRIHIRDFERHICETGRTPCGNSPSRIEQASVRIYEISHERGNRLSFPSVAVALRMVAGTMRDLRIVLGALASAPVITFEPMELLEGAQPSPERIFRAVERVGKRVCPVKKPGR
ncbi:MAG: hypothetical protein ACOYL3_02845 [Desulfuromonadaceae bacterium]